MCRRDGIPVKDKVIKGLLFETNHRMKKLQELDHSLTSLVPYRLGYAAWPLGKEFVPREASFFPFRIDPTLKSYLVKRSEQEFKQVNKT